MLTIEQAKVNNFPFKVNDRVEIRWGSPHGLVEQGSISELKTGVQHGHEVVYAIMVKIDGQEKPCVVGFDCIRKVS